MRSFAVYRLLPLGALHLYAVALVHAVQTAGLQAFRAASLASVPLHLLITRAASRCARARDSSSLARRGLK